MMKDIQRPISRRKFLTIAGSALAALAGGCALSGTPAAVENAAKPLRKAVKTLTGDTSLDADYIRQIITKDSQTSRTIMWHSPYEQDGAEVVWRAAGGEEYVSVPASNEHYTDDGQDIYLHSAHIEGLSKGASYEYRIIAKDSGTEWMPLKTDSGKSFKALIFPDTQCSDGYVTWRNVAQDAWKRNPDTDFFINMGDLVDNGEDHNQWNQWLTGVDGMISSIPFAPIMGNHETYTLDWKTRWPEAYLKLFDLPENGSREFNRHYYSYDYGDVHFAVVNTQWDELNDFKEGIYDEQLEWLPKDLAASKKKWKIVLLHRDVLRYGIKKRPERIPGISEDVGRGFMPIFDKYGVDVVLTAHLHTYRNRGHLYNFEPSSHGPYYILTGVAGNVRYPDLWIDHPLDKTVAPQPETDNYLTLEASENALHFQCFLPDGTIIDNVTLRK